MEFNPTEILRKLRSIGQTVLRIYDYVKNVLKSIVSSILDKKKYL